MKVFTDAQVTEIKHLLIEIEKSGNVQTTVYAERIRVIILQAEQVTFRLSF